MKVRELIKKLEAVENKELEVLVAPAQDIPEFDMKTGRTRAVERIGHLVLQYEIEGVHFTRTMTEDPPNERIIIMFDERPVEDLTGKA